MNVVPMNPRSRQHLVRGAVGVAGMAVALAVLASVAGLFGQASSMPWLPDTPANVAAMQRCEQAQGTAAKRVCAEAVVERVLSRNSATQLAQRSQPVGERAPIP